MMTSNGPPTPKGVGGPSPPLVSRGSEEGWEMEIIRKLRLYIYVV